MKDKYKYTVCVAHFCTVHKYTLIHASTQEKEREREGDLEREREREGGRGIIRIKGQQRENKQIGHYF